MVVIGWVARCGRDLYCAGRHVKVGIVSIHLRRDLVQYLLGGMKVVKWNLKSLLRVAFYVDSI